MRVTGPGFLTQVPTLGWVYGLVPGFGVWGLCFRGLGGFEKGLHKQITATGSLRVVSGLCKRVAV